MVEALLAAGLEVVVISPRQVRALRRRYGTAGNKDDRFDVFVLADVLRTDGHRLRPPLTPRPPSPCAPWSGPARTLLDLVSELFLQESAEVDQDAGEGEQWAQGALGPVVAQPEALEPQ